MSKSTASDEQKVKSTYADLFRGGLWLKTVCCCTIWMVGGLTYYGFNQYVGQTSPNPFVSVAVSGATQIPANLISIWLLKAVSRKKLMFIFNCLGGILILAMNFVPQHFWLTLTIAVLGIFCINIVLNTAYIYASELFPTVVRNMGMGVSSLSMRVGSMIAPYISDLSVSVPWLPTIIFGGTAVIAAVVSLLPPETKGLVLLDSLHEVRDKKNDK